MSAINITSYHVDDTKRIAEQLASVIEMGDCITLCGEVGAGKTTFSQYFISSLGIDIKAITSPTFTLVQWYDVQRPWQLCHADLYRINDASELVELGLEEAFEVHVMLLEWPEIAASIIPETSLHIAIEPVDDMVRNFRLHSSCVRWKPILETIGKAYAK